ncbi:MAG: thiamine pyrophosphate-requiring protein [Acidimicrobiia bacterium]|nr:thiamine pyrophosphate-requiring protein [Acidimicrobiia bacterium]
MGRRTGPLRGPTTRVEPDQRNHARRPSPVHRHDPAHALEKGNIAMNVAQAIARILKAEGVEILFAYPVNPLIEAAAEVDIRTVIVRQERVGLHMADAYSRLSSGDKLGVFCMQHGPGAENAYGGVAQAYGESVPLMVIPMGYPTRVMNVEPNFSSWRQMNGVAKLTDHISDPKVVEEAMLRGFSALRNGPPRPVVIEVAADVFGAEAKDPTDTYVPALSTRSAPDPANVTAAAEVLAGADNPVIYAGQGVHYAKAWSELMELAELLQVPVTTTLAGKSSFPEDHPLALGTAGRTIGKQVRDFLDNADVVLAIGASLTRTGFGQRMPQTTIIHATGNPGDIQKDVPVEHALVGDAQLTLQALIDEIGSGPHAKADDRRETVPTEIASTREAWLDEWKPKLTNNDAPINPYRVVYELDRLVDKENCIVTHDAGSPRDQMTPFFNAVSPLGYLGWGKTTQLGYGLGLAMGAKLAHPEKLCINVWGDAAIGFTGMDFETAVRERIPILSILLNNFSMAIEIPIMQVAQEKYGSTDISGNYADMATAFGGYGERIEDPNDIVAALQRGIAKTEEGVPVLLEFITDKEISYSTY